MTGKPGVDMPPVIVDTREKDPYLFRGYSVTVERVGLPTGDYSIQGCEHLVAIERKSLPDLLGCLTASRKRFIEELVRAQRLKYFAVVVESDLVHLAAGNYRSAMNPNAAMQSIAAFMVRMKTPFIWCGSRKLGEYMTFSLLEKFYRGTQLNSVKESK